VLYQGATPVFADVCGDTLNVDPAQIEARLTPRTRAILSVDYAGHPADLDAILEIARRHRLVVIEDACHALGAEYHGRLVGNIADMTIFSFHPVKHITTGEGGMVTTSDSELARRLRLFRNHGIDSDARQRQAHAQWQYEMVALGYNYRLSDVSCALGMSQLRRIAPNLERRRELARRYNAAFNGRPGVIPLTVRANNNPAWHLYPIRLDLAARSVTRAEVFRALRAENIGVNVHYIPVHLHPYYRDRFGYRGGEYPIAEEAYEKLISLPMFHAMSNQDFEDVIEAVLKVMDHYSIGDNEIRFPKWRP